MNEKNVLIVEDDPDHAYLILDILKIDNAKSRLILMKNAQKAIDYLLGADLSDSVEYKDRNGSNGRESRADLIVLDINLPKINGMFVLKLLKKNSRYCTVPVIILSTSSDKETIREAYENGANAYITKPISYNEFVAKIKSMKKYWLDTNSLPEKE